MNKLSVFNQEGGFNKNIVESFQNNVDLEDLVIMSDFNGTTVFLGQKYILTNDAILLPENKTYYFDDIEEAYWVSSDLSIDKDIMEGIILTAILIADGQISVNTTHPMILEVIELLKSPKPKMISV